LQRAIEIGLEEMKKTGEFESPQIQQQFHRNNEENAD
jgi:hypothetical protein